MCIRDRPEAEVGAVAPQRAVQQGPVPLVGGECGETVQRGQFLVRLRGVQLGQLGGAEGVDALPGAGGEVADGAEESAVEVVLRPQPRYVGPGAARVGVGAPFPPAVPVVGVGGERLDHALGAVVQQRVERGLPVGAVRERRADLLDDGGVALGEDGVGEAAGFVAEDHGRGVVHAATVSRAPGPSPAQTPLASRSSWVARVR